MATSLMNLKKNVPVQACKYVYPSGVGVRVLIVDFDRTCCKILSKMLGVMGYEVVVAEQARDALCILHGRRNEFDLIITEIHLPDMDKDNVLDTMVALSGLPVVVFTADNEETAILDCFSKGAELYLVKPITMSDVKILWQLAYMNEGPRAISEVSIDETDSFVGDSSLESPLSKGLEMDNVKEVNANGSTNQTLFWNDEVHDRYLKAVKIFGKEYFRNPRNIIQYMNIDGLTEGNLLTHLRKYRISLEREYIAHVQRILMDTEEPRIEGYQSNHNNMINAEVVLVSNDPLYSTYAAMNEESQGLGEIMDMDLDELLGEVESGTEVENFIVEGTGIVEEFPLQLLSPPPFSPPSPPQQEQEEEEEEEHGVSKADEEHGCLSE